MGIIAKSVVYLLFATISFWIGMHLGFYGVGREGPPTLPPSEVVVSSSEELVVQDCSGVAILPGDEIELPCPEVRPRGVSYSSSFASMRGSGDCPIPDVVLPVLHKSEAESTAVQVFPLLHHPGSLVCSEGEVILTQGTPWILNGTSKDTPFTLSPCQTVYMTRTGSKAGMPNKCAAIVSVQQDSSSPYFQTIRRGISAGIKEAYQKDFAVKSQYLNSYDLERSLLGPMLRDIDKLKAEFLGVMGDPIDANGTRRTVTIMVVNTGVMDLLLNLVCSSAVAKISMKDTLVYVGQQEDVQLVQNMGLRALTSSSLGRIPRNAAEHYADRTFAQLMWLKVTAVYIASVCGFHVLFQDVDLVWIKDPYPFLLNLPGDISFMDDGAKSPRFAPFFANSGFYYAKYNERTRFLMEKMLKSVVEISVSHSHQSVLMRHLVEAHHVIANGLSVVVLDLKDFPSGFMFHHDKDYISLLKAYQTIPYVFHMCWTDSRTDKVKYFKELGMWFLSEGNKQCENADYMRIKQSRDDLLGKCCAVGSYWQKMPIELKTGI